MPDTMLGEAMLDEAWQLSPAVALRPEPFGALAYHFGNRKLTFLKRPELVVVVRGLAEHPDVRSALAAAGISPSAYGAYAAALRGLAETDMIRRRPGTGSAADDNDPHLDQPRGPRIEPGLDLEEHS